MTSRSSFRVPDHGRHGQERPLGDRHDPQRQRRHQRQRQQRQQRQQHQQRRTPEIAGVNGQETAPVSCTEGQDRRFPRVSRMGTTPGFLGPLKRSITRRFSRISPQPNPSAGAETPAAQDGIPRPPFTRNIAALRPGSTIPRRPGPNHPESSHSRTPRCHFTPVHHVRIQGHTVV